MWKSWLISIKLTSNHIIDYDLLVMIASNLELFDIFPNPLLTKMFMYWDETLFLLTHSTHKFKFCFNMLRPNNRRKKLNHDLNYSFIHLSYGL